MNFMNLLELGVAPFVIFIFWTGIQKAIIEPLATGLVLSGVRRFLAPAWDELDKRLQLPGAFEEWQTKGQAWLYHQIIPEESKDILTPQQLANLLNILEAEFNMKVHREKANG